MDLDPYERSFRHVSTHLLLRDVKEESVREALAQGRAYVAFDWMGDPTGFVFCAQHDEKHWPLGSEITWAPKLRLRAEALLPGTIKLLRNGQPFQTVKGRTLDVELTEAGVYRVEVWLSFVGEERPWILSNPIYVREAREAHRHR
jgi:hypothetical protein